MASNSFGEIFRITTFGESHGPALGVVIDGCPPGIPLSEADFLPDLARRRPGQSGVTSARNEADTPEILSGTFGQMTTGMPITVIVRNVGHRSEDYDALKAVVRPGHADETYAAKFGVRDHRGGGRSSGRETVARVIAGVVAKKILPSDCRIIAHTRQIGPHIAREFLPETIEKNAVRCADPSVAVAMEAYLAELKAAYDSTGGIIAIVIQNPPRGLGDPVFLKLKARLADAVMSIGAVTGFAYGAGFKTATMRGKDYIADRRNFGGLLGGISTGETIECEASIKPTTSIGDIAKAGRHDPCVCPRVVPVIEAMVAICLADALLLQRATGRA